MPDPAPQNRFCWQDFETRVIEDQILWFIAARYGARNLCYLPAHVAAEVCKRRADFVRATKGYCQPELF